MVLPDMAVGMYDWALIVDHQRHTVSLLSHNDVNARGLAGKPAILAAEVPRSLPTGNPI